MSKITRAIQKIFGGSLSASTNIAQFGSLAAGSPAYSLDPVVIQGLSEFGNGWAAATVGNLDPALQDRNALDYLFSRQLAYLFQAGIAEYDSTTTYYTGSLAQDGTGWGIYLSIVDNNTGNALTNTSYWIPLFQSNIPSLCKAWVVFDGRATISTPCVVLDSYNIDHVEQIATGQWDIYFTTPFANNTYAFAGSCGPQDGLSPTAGDNNIIVGLNVKKTNHCEIGAWEAGTMLAFENCSSVSVHFFGTQAATP